MTNPSDSTGQRIEEIRQRVDKFNNGPLSDPVEAVYLANDIIAQDAPFILETIAKQAAEIEGLREKLKGAEEALENIKAERSCLSRGRTSHCGCASDAWGKKRLAENALYRIRGES